MHSPRQALTKFGTLTAVLALVLLVSVAHAKGGGDGSGGDAGKSDFGQVQTVHEANLVTMAGLLKRIDMVVTGTGTLDRRWTPRRLQLLKDMLHGNQRQSMPVRELWPRIEWRLKRTACDAKDKRHTDGAAKAPGTVCISLKTLSRYAYDELPQRMIPLYAHELAHLYFGPGEDEANEVEAFFSEISEIAFPDADRISHLYEEELAFPGPNTPSCGGILVYYTFGTVLQFRNVFLRPKPRLYLPPEFLERITLARAYVDKLQTRNQNGWNLVCEQSGPDAFFFRDEEAAAKASFESAIDYFRAFYSEIFSEMKPIDVQAGK